MPAVLKKYEPLDKTLMEIYDKERKERNEAINKLWQWREGHHPATLEVVAGERDDNLYFNLAGQIIDDIGEFMGQPQIVAEGENAETANELLKLVFETNVFGEMAADAIEAGNVAGHVFLRLAIPDGTPTQGEMPQFDEDDLPEFSLLDARYVAVFWDITRVGTKKARLWYRLMWEVGKDIYMQDIVPDFLLKTEDEEAEDVWWIIEYVGKNSSSKFEETARQVWPYPFAPIVDWKNARKPHSFYGNTTLTESSLRLNNGVNFVASNIGKIIKFHGHPKTIITGLPDSGDIDVRPDGLVTFPIGKNDGLDVFNLEMQSDLASSSHFLEKLESRFFSERRVLDQAAIKDKVGGLTNFGVRMLYLNMLLMIDEKRKLYGDGFAELARRILAMFGIDGVTIVTRWTDPLPVNRAELVAAAETEKQIGVTSPQTLAKELGRDYDAELQKRQESSKAEAELKINERVKMNERGVF
jgi:hypothetical protein